MQNANPKKVFDSTYLDGASGFVERANSHAVAVGGTRALSPSPTDQRSQVDQGASRQD